MQVFPTRRAGASANGASREAERCARGVRGGVQSASIPGAAFAEVVFTQGVASAQMRWLAGMALGMILALCALAMPQQAHAVVNLGTVGVAVPSSITLESGQTGQVTAACDPAYSDQYPNCLNDYCPSGCDFGKTGDGVACEDATGQCTCYGYKSARYYPSCTVASSNPSVVRASWSNGTLSITGYKAGEATLTLTPSLRLFSSENATVQVSVLAPVEQQSETSQEASPSAATASESSETTSEAVQGTKKSSQTSSSTGAVTASSTAGSATASVSVASGSGTTSASDTGAAAVASSAQSTTRAGSGASRVVNVIEQADSGSAVQDSADVGGATVSSQAVYKLDGDTKVGEVLAQAAGTAQVLTFWGGQKAESPDYMLVIAGANVPADIDAGLELAIAQADDQLAEQLGGLEYTAFSIDGAKKLPCTAQMFWRTTKVFPNDAIVSVYHFDRESGTFKKIHSNIKIAEGYACFNLIDGGTYVISTKEDLDAATEQAPADEGDSAGDPEGDKEAAEGDEQDAHDVGADADAEANASESDGDEAGTAPLKSMPPWSGPTGVVAIAAAAGVAAYATKRKGAGNPAAASAATSGEGGEDVE